MSRDRKLRGHGFARKLLDTIAVTVMVALIACGVFAIVPPSGAMHEKRLGRAFVAARTIGNAATLSLAVRDSACPTIDDLIAEGRIDAGSRADPWGSAWRIDCTDGEASAWSMGADRAAWTDDDISSRMTRAQLGRVLAMPVTEGIEQRIFPFAAAAVALPVALSSVCLSAAIFVGGS